MLFIFQLLETLLFRRFWEFLLLAVKKKIEDFDQNELSL
ncbi:hypothetical protein SR187_1970 [Streptococcus ruminantium]|uniref:Uncharacterized protein n=1 Tax=Streptococcus ruminantium TaxID=1917441 RepID=A0A2Z5TKW3_9STRE|nr:hypothetical protein SR187_1970 [Streptococcus ruminantium]